MFSQSSSSSYHRSTGQPALPSIPIYLVIVDRDSGMGYQTGGYNIERLREVLACNLRDYPQLYQEKLAPLYNQGQNVTVYLFYREPPNPLRDQLAQQEGKQEGAPHA